MNVSWTRVQYWTKSYKAELQLLRRYRDEGAPGKEMHARYTEVGRHNQGRHAGLVEADCGIIDQMAETDLGRTILKEEGLWADLSLHDPNPTAAYLSELVRLAQTREAKTEQQHLRDCFKVGRDNDGRSGAQVDADVAAMAESMKSDNGRRGIRAFGVEIGEHSEP